jgi:hypothetical protein
MEDIIIDKEEVKAVVLSVLKEKVATRHTYQAVDNIVARILAEEEKPLESFLRSALKFVTNFKVRSRKSFISCQSDGW